MSTTTQSAVLKGGEWLIRESVPAETFIPEDFSEEQRMIMDMCSQFLDTEVVPVYERIEKMESGLMQSLQARLPFRQQMPSSCRGLEHFQVQCRC